MPTQSNMPRLFLALELPDTVKTQLSLLPGEIPGARWLDTEQYHITLKFLGDTPASRVAKLVDELEGLEFPILHLQALGIGLFPLRGEPETLWIGIENDIHLMRMQRHLEKHLSLRGFPREGRHYFPHISLARLKQPSLPHLGAYLARQAQFKIESMMISDYVLYSSHGTSMGSYYAEEARFPLYGITGNEFEEEDDDDDDDDKAGEAEMPDGKDE